MSTHYYPYSSDEAEVAACGTLLGYGGDVTSNWGLVDCKRCLQRKSQIMAAHSMEEAAIVEQMGDMVAYFKRASGGQDE